MWLLSFEGLKLPGSAAARSRPTEGFSAMTRVLLTRSSLACAIRRAPFDGDLRPAEPPDRAFRSPRAEPARSQCAQGPVPTAPLAFPSASATIESGTPK